MILLTCFQLLHTTAGGKARDVRGIDSYGWYNVLEISEEDDAAYNAGKNRPYFIQSSN